MDVFAPPSVLRPGGIVVVSAHDPISNFFFVCHSPVGLMNAGHQR